MLISFWDYFCELKKGGITLKRLFFGIKFYAWMFCILVFVLIVTASFVLFKTGFSLITFSIAGGAVLFFSFVIFAVLHDMALIDTNVQVREANAAIFKAKRCKCGW